MDTTTRLHPPLTLSRSRPLTALLVAALWLALAFATYHGWIHGANHRDFYPRWQGARLALYEGYDLYSAASTREMQARLYGGPIPDGADPQAFAHPAIIVPLLLPFWLIPNVEIAAAAWEATSVLLMLGVLLWLRPPGVRAWRAVLWVGWYYTILMVFQAQFTALPLASLGLAYGLYQREHDGLAGMALAVGFIKPELMLVPALLMLMVALSERRPVVILSFALSGAGVLALSTLIAGWWITDWLAALQRYAGYAPTQWAIAALWRLHPLVAVAAVSALVYGLTRTRWTMRRAVAVGLPLGFLLLPQTLIWGLTLLALPMALMSDERPRLTLLVWGVGWLLVPVFVLPEGWRIQSVALPLLALLVIGLPVSHNRTCRV